MISNESLEQLKQSIDIVEILGSYIQLKKAGANYSACCPFHHEKTASFMVSPSKGIYHCYGCGVGGDAIKFVMEYEKLSFVESIEKIASIMNFELVYTQEKSKKQDSKFLDKIASFYHQKLLSSPQVLDYAYRRGITQESIERFYLGFCGAGFESVRFADEMGARSEAIELGVLGRDNERVYARFFDRLMFPIYSPNSSVVGFGGRIMEGDNVAKYINSPQTKVFNKSKLLYAYHLAKESIFRQKQIIITEGYIDVIMLHQAGIKNAVATLGTALTSEHLPLLNRGEPKIIVSYDGDKAGINAAFKASKLLAQEGKDGGVVIFEGGLDPADMIVAGRVEEVKGLFASPIPFVKFVLEQMVLNYDLHNPLEKEKALKESLEFLHSLSSLIQEEYKLFLASLLKVPPTLIRTKNQKVPKTPQTSIQEVYDVVEVALIASMYENESFLDFGVEYLEKTSFKECQREYELLLSGERENPLLQGLLMRESARVMSEEEFKKQIKIKAIQDYEEKIKLLISKEGIEYETKIRQMQEMREKINKIKKEIIL